MWSKVEKLMKERNMNILKLAEITGIPATTIYSWKDSESGRIVNAYTLAKLARVFEVSIEDLM